jgi:hypothetical protein
VKVNTFSGWTKYFLSGPSSLVRERKIFHTFFDGPTLLLREDNLLPITGKKCNLELSDREALFQAVRDVSGWGFSGPKSLPRC